MSTTWSEIISNYAMQNIDDVRLTEDAAISPALFMRRMSLYLNQAVSLFNSPPEVQDFLRTGMTLPDYDDAEWTSTVQSVSAQTVVSTGKVGYGLFSCVVPEVNGAGETTLTPYKEAVYDPQTGNVTFPKQNRARIAYQMDFYTDGTFAGAVTERQKQILGLCVAKKWFERFSNNWLNMQPKLQDDSFRIGSENAHMVSVTARKKEIWSSLQDEIHKYEQDCAYKTALGGGGTIVLL